MVILLRNKGVKGFWGEWFVIVLGLGRERFEDLFKLFVKYKFSLSL